MQTIKNITVALAIFKICMLHLVDAFVDWATAKLLYKIEIFYFVCISNDLYEKNIFLKQYHLNGLFLSMFCFSLLLVGGLRTNA